MTDLELALLGVLWLACGFVAYAIARRRGLPGTAPFVTGVILGPVGVLLVLIQKRAEPVRWDG